MPALRIHEMKCPDCDKKFYVDLPEEGDTVKQTECVHCNETIRREYEFTEQSDGNVLVRSEVSIQEDESKD